MNIAPLMARWGRNVCRAYWHANALLCMAIGSVLLAMPAWAADGDDISKIIGAEGSVRKTVRTGLDFGLWLVAVLGMCLAVAGMWSAYQQIKQQEQQRQWGKPLMMISFGGLLAGAKKIWEWIAASFTGDTVPDVTKGSKFGDPTSLDLSGSWDSLWLAVQALLS